MDYVSHKMILDFVFRRFLASIKTKQKTITPFLIQKASVNSQELDFTTVVWNLEESLKQKVELIRVRSSHPSPIIKDAAALVVITMDETSKFPNHLMGLLEESNKMVLVLGQEWHIESLLKTHKELLERFIHFEINQKAEIISKMNSLFQK